VAGLCPDPLGELITLPRNPSWIKRGRRERGRIRKGGLPPPVSEVC